MITSTIITIQDSPCLQQATLYQDRDLAPRALIFYLHGGGLLYGSREDLPELHKKKLTEKGYVILALDYPLAPAARIPEILDTIMTGIRRVLSGQLDLRPLISLPHSTSDTGNLDSSSDSASMPLPYILWGRSSGAYLALLAASHVDEYQLPFPQAILSYYGYGFLVDDWADTPAPYYSALPQVPASCLETLPEAPHMEGPLETHYSAYVYARQSGQWLRLIQASDAVHFQENYTLKNVRTLPCPLFCTHALEDPDVPFAEYQALAQRFNPVKYLTGGNVHDFDRKDSSYTCKKLLDMTVKFLDQVLL